MSPINCLTKLRWGYSPTVCVCYLSFSMLCSQAGPAMHAFRLFKCTLTVCRLSGRCNIVLYLSTHSMTRSNIEILPGFMSQFNPFNQKLAGQCQVLQVEHWLPADVTRSLLCSLSSPIIWQSFHTPHSALVARFLHHPILPLAAIATRPLDHYILTFHVAMCLWGDLVLRRLITRNFNVHELDGHLSCSLHRCPFHLLQL